MNKFLTVKNLAILVPVILALTQLVDFFIRPYVVYTTVEIETYPVIWTTDDELNEKLPLKFHRVVAKHVAKMTGVSIRNVGGRTAKDVYIDFPRKDDYKGWIVQSGVDDQKELDFMRPTIKLDKLIPGESVSIYVYAPSSDESITEKIDVRYDGGGKAKHYPSMPVPHYVGYIITRPLGQYIPLVFLVLAFWSGLYWYNRSKGLSAKR